MKIFLAAAILVFGFLGASAQTEQAPILEKEISYKNWKYKTVRDDKDFDLRDFAQNKKLVLVVYFAPWCPNWKHEAPFVQKIYDKYKANGLEIVGVGEYGTVDTMKASLDSFKITFPVVYESTASDAKQKTAHYEYRKAAGDMRNWGSPWNIFLEPAKLEKKGDVLLKKTYVVNGELIEPEAEAFIREKLGLPKEDKKVAEVKTVESCDPEKNISTLKKP